MTHTVTLDTIRAAADRIAGEVVRTPLIRSTSLSDLASAPVFLKLEIRQTTGSFKLRGATNAVLSLPPEARKTGIAAASTGNHGRGLAHAAARQGLRCVVCMSALVPENKVAAIRALGAEIRIVGRSQDDAQGEVDRLVAEEGFTAIPPFDHADVISGQGTIGLEIVADLPEVAQVVVPLSGGGLFGGIAAAVKGLRPQARMVGVSMARGPAMRDSLTAGRPVAVAELPTLADSLGGGIGLDNRHTFALARDLLDEAVLLTEAEIAAAIDHAYAAEQEIVEGGGAVGIGALLAGKLTVSGPTVLVLSGRNIDMALHRKIVSGAWEETPCPA
ncbi:MAG TPA: hydroxyectoine utilization dehydratase EutB [Inquilinus sp.]